ncbi:hypothetical protein D5018_11120 [Parashewanella curva]|uniref:NlpC/P60 domain-containing protein n=1 Tax=Parashewanella curva TaxID=2338552 RepID=A0A3L8PZS4_9GAMM|nr:hypothetical protein [Parashewanella curva]RLV59592.1 hypothetical protein D5018_11120 [Parashewanella curva]
MFDKRLPAGWKLSLSTKFEPSVSGAQATKIMYVTLPYAQASTPWAQALIRFNKLFSDGLEQVCQTVLFNKGVKFPSDGCCHHFANYLIFGMKKQAYLDRDFKEWYDQLPFVEILSFSELTVRWGDIIQHTHMGKLIHSMVYVGDSRYISRHGNTYIYFQSLEATKLSYPSDSSRIIRLLPEFYSTELEFKLCYSSAT